MSATITALLALEKVSETAERVLRDSKTLLEEYRKVKEENEQLWAEVARLKKIVDERRAR